MADPQAHQPTVDSLQAENERLKRSVEELSILNDLARAIAGSLDPQAIMETIIRRSLRAVHAEQCDITLVEQQSADPSKTLVRAMASSSKHEQFHLHESLLGWMHVNKKSLLMNEPAGDERFRGIRWDDSIRSLLCVPMMIKSGLQGVLTVYNKKGVGFTEGDQRLLTIIAAQSAQVVENARLNEREKQLLKMQEEVRLAARIQHDLLPKGPPEVPGYDIAGRTIPAQTVGGDYFDFIPISNRMVGICLGDASGKGLPASLLMANTQAILRGQAVQTPSAQQCVRQSNRLLFQNTNAEKFVTLFYCMLDSSAHRLAYSNAGQGHPLLLSAGNESAFLEEGGPALGMLEDFPFEGAEVPLQGGDILVVWSDGIEEATNASGVQFGTERLTDMIRRNRDGNSTGIIDAIVEAVQTHTGSTTQADDMTLVVVKRISA